jgi:hypothetical protein
MFKFVAKQAVDSKVNDFTMGGPMPVAGPAETDLRTPASEPTDAKRGGFAKPDDFLRGDDAPAYVGGDSRPKTDVRPLQPYAMQEGSGAGTMRPDPFLTPGESEAVEPAQFSPSKPGPLRLGDAYQLPAMSAVSKRSNVSFADVILPEGK